MTNSEDDQSQSQSVEVCVEEYTPTGRKRRLGNYAPKPVSKGFCLKYTLFCVGMAAVGAAGVGVGYAIYKNTWGKDPSNGEVQSSMLAVLPGVENATTNETDVPTYAPSYVPTPSPTEEPSYVPTYVPTDGDVSPLETTEMIMSTDNEPERRTTDARRGRDEEGHAFGQVSARASGVRGRNSRE